MNIVDIVTGYQIELKKVGSVYIGLCPFHNDQNNPNLTVYPKTNSFYCFACGVGGDIIKFISLIEQIPRKQVIERFGLELVKQKLFKVENERNFKEETNFLVSTICRTYLQKHKNQVDKVLKVLEKFDQKLDSVDTLSCEEGFKLVEKFKKIVYNIT